MSKSELQKGDRRVVIHKNNEIHFPDSDFGFLKCLAVITSLSASYVQYFHNFSHTDLICSFNKHRESHLFDSSILQQ